MRFVIHVVGTELIVERYEAGRRIPIYRGPADRETVLDAGMAEAKLFEPGREHLGHRKWTHPEDENFYAREGCLDCDEWLEPARAKMR